MPLIPEEDVLAIATYTHNLKAVARDVRVALAAFDCARQRGQRPTQVSACAVSGCEMRFYAKGYCFRHYINRRRYKAKGMLPATWVDNALPGSVPDATGWELKRQAGGAA